MPALAPPASTAAVIVDMDSLPASVHSCVAFSTLRSAPCSASSLPAQAARCAGHTLRASLTTVVAPSTLAPDSPLTESASNSSSAGNAPATARAAIAGRCAAHCATAACCSTLESKDRSSPPSRVISDPSWEPDTHVVEGSRWGPVGGGGSGGGEVRCSGSNCSARARPAGERRSSAGAEAESSTSASSPVDARCFAPPLNRTIARSLLCARPPLQPQAQPTVNARSRGPRTAVHQRTSC